MRPSIARSHASGNKTSKLRDMLLRILLIPSLSLSIEVLIRRPEFPCLLFNQAFSLCIFAWCWNVPGKCKLAKAFWSYQLVQARKTVAIMGTSVLAGPKTKVCSSTSINKREGHSSLDVMAGLNIVATTKIIRRAFGLPKIILWWLRHWKRKSTDNF